MENGVADDTRLIMSEAAQRSYVESGGSVDAALQAFQLTLRRWRSGVVRTA
jgi:hypothetical protein